MVLLGRSKSGTEMRINRRGVDAHKIVIISSVEPHYFAGYTGGRKSFLPGIASYETIEQNHKLALRPEACALKLKGNPVHEDMVDALSVVKKDIFVINTVLDKNHRIYAATAGDIDTSLERAIVKANDVFISKIPEKTDIVVSVVKFPADIDLYQAQKGIDNAKYALRKRNPDTGSKMPHGHRRGVFCEVVEFGPIRQGTHCNALRRNISWAITRRQKWRKWACGLKHGLLPTSIRNYSKKSLFAPFPLCRQHWMQH